MATIKIKSIKTGIAASIDYIMDKNKTNNQTLVSSFGCDKDTAIDDFNEILNNSISQNRSVKGQHIIQSFKPGEIDLNTAHEAGIQLADKFLKDRHQYVIATHVDKKHIHNHIVFNNVSHIDYKAFENKKKNIYLLREISDDICRSYGLSVIEKSSPSRTRLDPKVYRGKYSNSFRQQIKNDIDTILRESFNYEDFIEKMKCIGYEINQKKFTTIKHKTNGQQRPIRMERLGANYSKSMIEFRINNEFVDIKKHIFKPLDNNWIDKVIDITSNEKINNSPGLRYWAIRQNNKIMLRTLNRMNQLGCGSYNQVNTYIKQLQEIYENDEKEIKEINSEINRLKDIISKAESVKEKINLVNHANLLSSPEKEEFLREHSLDTNDLSQFENFKGDLLMKGIVIDSEDDLMEFIKLNKDKLENKRERTESLLLDQQKELNFISEMQQLANNYDRFIGRPPQYEIQKDSTIKR